MSSAAPSDVRRHGAWLWLLTGLAIGLFGLGFLVRYTCSRGACLLGAHEWLVDPDAVGGLPRMFTTALLVAVGVAAGLTARRLLGADRWWWTGVAVLGAALGLAKLVSAHSVLERTDGTSRTLLVGTAGTLVGLPLLWATGRRWRVPGAAVVVGALAAYAVAAIGLDAVTRTVAALDPRPFPLAAATSVEELGEALAALLVLAVVVARVPADHPMGCDCPDRSGNRSLPG